MRVTRIDNSVWSGSRLTTQQPVADVDGKHDDVRACGNSGKRHSGPSRDRRLWIISALVPHNGFAGITHSRSHVYHLRPANSPDDRNSGGSDGARTRDLLRDRPKVNPESGWVPKCRPMFINPIQLNVKPDFLQHRTLIDNWTA